MGGPRVGNRLVAAAADGRFTGRSVPLPGWADGSFAVSPDAVWVAQHRRCRHGRVGRLVAGAGRLVSVGRAGRTPVGIAVSAGVAWVTNFADGTVTRIAA